MDGGRRPVGLPRLCHALNITAILEQKGHLDPDGSATWADSIEVLSVSVFDDVEVRPEKLGWLALDGVRFLHPDGSRRKDPGEVTLEDEFVFDQDGHRAWCEACDEHFDAELDHEFEIVVSQEGWPLVIERRTSEEWRALVESSEQRDRDFIEKTLLCLGGSAPKVAKMA